MQKIDPVSFCILLDEVKRARVCHTEAELAKLIEVQPSTLSHYRSGYRSPSIDRIEAIAMLLGLEVEYVLLRLREKGDPQQSPACRCKAQCVDKKLAA